MISEDIVKKLELVSSRLESVQKTTIELAEENEKLRKMLVSIYKHNKLLVEKTKKP